MAIQAVAAKGAASSAAKGASAAGKATTTSSFNFSGGLGTDILGGFVYKPIQTRKARQFAREQYEDQSQRDERRLRMEELLSKQAYRKNQMDENWRKQFSYAMLGI